MTIATPPIPDELRLYSPESTADILRVTVRTLGEWRRLGRGPKFIKLTGSKLVAYRPADISAWLDSRTRSSTSDDPRPKRVRRKRASKAA
jgi:hypothetical protein